MKLIDKESLMEVINCNKPLADGYHMKDYVFNQIITDIESEPTVEAIPVEWIENYAKENYPIWDRHAPIRAFYTNMIKVWRKENGIN